jgi:hypothetical protein
VLDEFAFPNRIDHAEHITTRQYARLVDEWVTGIGLRPENYGTHLRSYSSLVEAPDSAPPPRCGLRATAQKWPSALAAQRSEAVVRQIESWVVRACSSVPMFAGGPMSKLSSSAPSPGSVASTAPSTTRASPCRALAGFLKTCRVILVRSSDSWSARDSLRDWRATPG